MVVSVEEVRNELDRIFDSSSSDIQRITKCRILLNNVISTWSTDVLEMLKEVIKFLAQDNVNLFVSRQMFSDFCMRLLPVLPDSQYKLLAQFMLKEMQPREVNFEYHMSIICHHLSYIYEKEENWKEAANFLASIPAESYYRFSVDYEMELYLKIAQLYMEDDDPLIADPYIKKTSVLKFLTSNNDLLLTYKVCYARMLDFRLKFIEAAQEYHELSNCQSLNVNERLTALKNTLVCTILSFSGEIRTQLLKSLFDDERCKIFIKTSTLGKLCSLQIIKSHEINEIAKLLLPHQKAETNYGTSILVEAIAQHNIQSIERLYENIKIESLGRLLGFEPCKAELMVGRMISEGRIEGSINQKNGFITFKLRNPNELLESWTEIIESLNNQFNRMNELLLANSSLQKDKKDHTDV
ncbi:COP9 signalosome complex subunit 4-like [Acyrthosiphon pisum]|uniref:COP9 signalosome complex subunit 4 n=1 Tax=Acyrthosiphon pisum TaxID=7029 RepID=A0A8R2A0Q2_ACYPI|nr:COP9 signalosome complex subunit 4-like [Acyrthosiphon pisum]XP_016662850.1 COP9 signalosome complex subunit 4-like [Acyrthosiphon pisum]|eukprot:XP_001943227.1 PREDICTED: COP9 signalosome complex subunit 4-like isoform X1 [Acyrthosiphon pisum]